MAPDPELHPLFDPDVLAEVAALRERWIWNQAHAGWLAELEQAEMQDPTVQALDRVCRMLQEQREATRQIKETVDRLAAILAGDA
jgi:hypothetical protein